MKTSDFINSLASDAATVEMRPGPRFALSVALGAVLSAALFMATVGPRRDIAAAVHTLRFDLKFVDTLALALPSLLLCVRLMRPDFRPGVLAALLAAPFVLLAGAVIVELSVLPSDLWATRWIGSNAVHCMTIIPLLSIAPLMAMIYALRSGASTRPGWTGALAGATAAGLAATLYATNCPDDSPLFVASWYPIATAIVVLFGAWLGRRMLRW